MLTQGTDLTGRTFLSWPTGSCLQGWQVDTVVCWMLQTSVQALTRGEQRTVYTHCWWGRSSTMWREVLVGSIAEPFTRKLHKCGYWWNIPWDTLPAESPCCLHSLRSWPLHSKPYRHPSHTSQEGQALPQQLPLPISTLSFIHQGPVVGSCVAVGPSQPSPPVAHRWQWSHHCSQAGGQWENWQERQPPKSSVLQVGAQAALMKMPAVRVFMVQNSCTAEVRPEGLNLQLTQIAVVMMQLLQL